MEDVGYHQSNLLNDIVSHMSSLPATYPLQGCQEPVYAPTTTPIPYSVPAMEPIFQPYPGANSDTDVTSTILHQLLTSMQHMKQLAVQIQANQAGGGGQTNNRNTRCLPTCQAATETIESQPHKPLPYFATKYFWTHIKCAHEGSACKNKAPKYQDTSKISCSSSSRLVSVS